MSQWYIIDVKSSKKPFSTLTTSMLIIGWISLWFSLRHNWPKIHNLSVAGQKKGRGALSCLKKKGGGGREPE